MAGALGSSRGSDFGHSPVVDRRTRVAQSDFYTIDAKLYDPPAKPIPLFTAANGKKSMRLAANTATD